MLYTVKFGAFIRAGRERKGLSQSDLANVLNITQPHYSRLESGERIADLAQIMTICKTLGLDFNDFVKQFN